MQAPGEIALALVYLVGALFNLVYTRTHGRKLFAQFADGAWVSAYGTLIRRVVVRNATLFALTLALFEAAVAAMLLSRGTLVTPALALGLLFTLAALAASRGGGLAVNVVLAIAHVALLQGRLGDG